jgi:hypothetical protein
VDPFWDVLLVGIICGGLLLLAPWAWHGQLSGAQFAILVSFLALYARLALGRLRQPPR